MFTGIVQEVGELTALRESGGKRYLTLACREVPADLRPGDSLACDGVCLTVLSFTDATVTVEAMAETLRKTTVADWARGRRVNLERALCLNGRLDGHLVQGHVDTVSKVLAVRRDGETVYPAFALPRQEAALVAPQGSIAVNGVSLPVATLAADRYEVALIGHTLMHTTLAGLRPGDAVNIEYDIIGKYVLRRTQGDKTHMSEEWLREQGY